VGIGKSPAFLFYPDKWQSHTRRLSDSAYRVYHELLCWMWQSSPDQCSIEADPEAVACAVALPTQCVKDACAEILNAFAPLLRCENGRWVSNGLRKEVVKISARREQCRKAADASHKRADATKKPADASSSQCIPIPIPIPISIPNKTADSRSRITNQEIAREGISASAVGGFICTGFQTVTDALVNLERKNKRASMRASWTERVEIMRSKPGGEAYLAELLREVEDRDNPAICRAKGYSGPIRNKAAWATERITSWLARHAERSTR